MNDVVQLKCLNHSEVRKVLVFPESTTLQVGNWCDAFLTEKNSAKSLHSDPRAGTNAARRKKR